MNTLVSKAKIAILKIIACVLFHTGSLKLMQLILLCFRYGSGPATSNAFYFFKGRERRNCQILVYHRVNDEGDAMFPATPVSTFERQIGYLANNYDVYRLKDIIERIKHRDVPPNAIVITFDDGYYDNYTNAFPILTKYSVPATIFLATEVIGSGKLLWHDKVFSAFRDTRVECLEDYFGAGAYPLKTREEKLAAQGHVLRVLFSLNDDERVVWVERLIEKLKAGDVNNSDTSNLMLSWENVAKMQTGGIDFGSHSVTHPILSRVSISQLRSEIFESKRIIEEKLERPVVSFAYPKGGVGDFNQTTKTLLKEAGYHCALTTIFGANSAGQDLFELRRGAPWEPDVSTFAMKILWYGFRR